MTAQQGPSFPLKVKLEVPHNDENWHQWICLGEYVMRDTIGRKHPRGHWRWMVVQCNNTECKAQAIFSLGQVEDEVQRLIPVPLFKDRE